MTRICVLCLALFVLASCQPNRQAGSSDSAGSPETPPPPTDKELQKRTVEEMKLVGNALFAWVTDQVGAGAAGQSVSLYLYRRITTADLEQLLVPNYLPELPRHDAWGHPYEYFLDPENLLRENLFAIRSPGRDGVFSGKEYSHGTFPASQYDEDLVWTDGFWLRWPGKLPG